MKVVKGDSVIFIYPFVAEKAEEPSATLDAVAVWYNGTIKLIWNSAPVMTPVTARMLAEALLYAVENGPK